MPVPTPIPTPIPTPTPTSAPRPDDLIPHLPAMARRARRLTRSRDQADDLLQEAALRIWTRLARGTRVEDLRAYSMITLRNLARTHARRAQDEVSIEDDMATVDGDALRHLACCETRAAIARLPRAQAELLALVLAGQASPAALAGATGCPVGTVMSRLARAGQFAPRYGPWGGPVCHRSVLTALPPSARVFSDK